MKSMKIRPQILYGQKEFHPPQYFASNITKGKATGEFSVMGIVLKEDDRLPENVIECRDVDGTVLSRMILGN